MFRSRSKNCRKIWFWNGSSRLSRLNVWIENEESICHGYNILCFALIVKYTMLRFVDRKLVVVIIFIQVPGVCGAVRAESE